MTRYRLHIDGQPTERTCPKQHAYEWRPGWQWLEYEHEHEQRMTHAESCDGTIYLSRSPADYLKQYRKRIRQGKPRGMQLLKQEEQTRIAA